MKEKSPLIIYMGGFILPDKNAAALRVLANSKIFKSLGYKVILVGMNNAHDQANTIKDTYVSYQDFDCFSVPYPRSSLQWFKYVTNLEPLIQINKLYKNDISTVVLYNYPSVSMARMMGYCKKRKINIIGDCTEWYSSRNKKGHINIAKFLDSTYRMRFLQKKLSANIVISRFLEDYYKSSIPTICIPPLVDKSELKWMGVPEKEKQEFSIVYAGSPGRKDRLDLLVEAAFTTRLPIKIFVIGITKDEFLKLYPYLGLNKLKKISFLGRLTHLQALSYIQRANYSCFFRDYSRVTIAGFPTKFVESISAGVPVITNNTSDIDEYVDLIGGCKVISDISLSSIVKGLEDAFYQEGKVTNSDIFDYKKYIDKFIELFSQLEN